jgi:hypothetical protein
MINILKNGLAIVTRSVTANNAVKKLTCKGVYPYFTRYSAESCLA